MSRLSPKVIVCTLYPSICPFVGVIPSALHQRCVLLREVIRLILVFSYRRKMT